jgi:hypothetical protein
VEALQAVKNAYRYAIAYFTLFGGLLLISGFWLFALKIGFTPSQVAAYYLGDPSLFTAPKSFTGLMESALPHLGGMGLFVMVTAHFLHFAPKKKKRGAKKMAVALFVAALLDIFCPFAIINGFALFAWVKLAAFAALQLLGFALLWLVFSAAAQGIARERQEV